MIQDQAATLAKLSWLSANQIYHELNDYQILSLLTAQFASSHWVFKHIRWYQGVYGSLAAFIQAGSSNKSEGDFLNAIKKALHSWLLRSGQVRDVKNLHSQLVQRHLTEGADSDDRFDEEDIRQMQIQRLGGVRKEERTLDFLPIELLPAGDFNYRISDFPGKYHILSIIVRIQVWYAYNIVQECFNQLIFLNTTLLT